MLHPADRMPSALYTAAQCRELDRIAIEDFAIPGFDLMQRAGRVAFNRLLSQWAQPSLITVFCGSGNNGGDGYVIAALAARQNYSVQIVQVGDPAKLRGDAAKACRFAQEAGVNMLPFPSAETPVTGVIVDALLGTGSQNAPRGDYQQAIRMINNSGLPVLAVDLPSGLDPDTGQVKGDCVRAQVTTTFIGVKRGLCTGQAPAYTGKIFFDSLEVPPAVYSQVPSQVEHLRDGDFDHLLRPRAVDAHKGHFGHVLVIGGDLGMGGAVLMAAEAAGRVGAGLVSVATRPQHVSALLGRRPEFMVHGVDSADALDDMMERASVLVLGPGLGRSSWSRDIFARAMQGSQPRVVDADGLNLISENPDAFAKGVPWVLTPHPGEAARLLGQTVADVQTDRFASARQLQERFGGVAVLKGAGSLIASQNRIGVSTRGNPGMATGGMGDVLSGVIGGLLAQGFELADAAEAGVLIHGKAADLAAGDGQRGMLATDLFVHLRTLVNPL